MRKYVFIILVVGLAIYLAGCGKKKETLEQAQEPLSIEVSPTPTTPGQQAGAVVTPTPEKKTSEIPLSPQGPFKPTNQQIQTALKNAGYYTAEIDGKIGPKTKKAIEEFQKANGLKVDGKVGHKTWEVLSSHLNPTAVEPATEKRR